MKKTNFRQQIDEILALSTYVKLARAAESFSERIHAHLSESGLTVSQFGVLEALYHLGPLTQGALGEKILKSSGNMTMVIDNLEKRGLVRRVRNKEDRRFFMIHATDKGMQLIGSIFPRHARIIKKEMSVLTGEEQKKLSLLCRKLGTGK